MIVAGSANPLLMGVSTGYNLTRSLRFRASASAYLSRTPASSGSRTTWTWSDWVKRGQLGSFKTIFTTNDAVNNSTEFFFNTDDTIKFREYASSAGGYTAELYTTQVFRDPSAWYHIVLVWDSNNATSSDRLRLYINGTRVTAFSTANYPSSGRQTFFNSAYATTIGTNSSSSTFDGYRTELNFIDGQALTPSSFGETSSTTGVWQPKKYSGTYGTNGFYLPFTDNSALTSGSNAGLGKDFSGNSNYWNTNNISITSGSTYDSMTDVPTLTSATAANFCTWNPLSKTSNHTASDGNLTATSSSYGAMASTIGFSSGKWYWEVTCTNRTSTNSPSIGYCNELYNVASAVYLTENSNSGGINSINGNAATNGTSTSYGSAISTNDVVMFAFDADAKKMWVGKNGTWFNSGNPVTATNQYPYTITGSTFFPAINCYTDTYKANFGQQPFAYTPPTGYVALNTYNLPTPTIGATASSRANKYFDATTYTGTGVSGLQVTNAGGFQPDFVWVKVRNASDYHNLADSVRGVYKRIFSNDTQVENTNTETLQSFNSNGFTVGNNGNWNTNGAPLVAWQWKGGGTGVTNTAGSITSTVSANTTSGFSVVTWTGNGGSGSIGHGLGVAPAMYIVKSRSNVNSWTTYHQSLGATKYLALNTSDAAVTGSAAWGNNAPTSSVFYVDAVGFGNTATYVTYCFAEIAGYSKIGSFTGNGSTDGPFVYTGFRPKYIMSKSTSAARFWFATDTSRDPYNVCNLPLFPNDPQGETAGTTDFDILSNGFKARTTNAAVNGNGETIIYIAFAENPFKYSLAR